MGPIKDKNGRDLGDAEEITKTWKEYTEELYKKDLNEPDNYNGMVSHPNPDILECEAKWALRSTAVNKASGGNGIPIELFKSLKEDAIKILHSLCQQIWKTQQWPQDWKRSKFIQFHIYYLITGMSKIGTTLTSLAAKVSNNEKYFLEESQANTA